MCVCVCVYVCVRPLSLDWNFLWEEYSLLYIAWESPVSAQALFTDETLYVLYEPQLLILF